MKMDTKPIIVLVVIVGTLAIILSVNSVNNVNSVIEQAYAESDTDREDKALFYLSIVPKEKLSYLFEYCNTHSSLTGNVFMPVPEYVTCDEVILEKLNRGFDSLLTKLENMSQEELQEKFGTDDK
jgi:hypothetical protein